MIINEYITPVLVSLLDVKPEIVISAMVELPKPPVKDLFLCIKKSGG